MIRKLKALGLALLATFVLGALGAQGAQGVEDEFHFDGERAVLTGENSGVAKLQVGNAGFLECTTATLESTVVGSKVTEGTWKADEITARPNYSGCKFGGQPATVFVNDCAYVFDSDTAAGNATGGEHAKLTIECSAGNVIKIHTVSCTITIGPQAVANAVRFQPGSTTSINFDTTAHGVVLGRERNTVAQPLNGCLLFPIGAFGKLVGSTTVGCFKDKGSPEANATTPKATEEGEATDCPERSIVTGKQVGAHEFSLVGSEGKTLKCNAATFGSVIEGDVEEEGLPTKLTVKPSYSECTFGGKSATVDVNDCAYVLDFNEFPAGEEASDFEIECFEDPEEEKNNHKIEIHTEECTVTIGPQLVKDALRYEEDTASSFTLKTSGHITVGKQLEEGCKEFPTGAVGNLVGTSTVECFEDDGSLPANPTTPGATEEGEVTDCPYQEPSEQSIVTGEQTGLFKLTVGEAGFIECETGSFEGTIRRNIEEDGLPARLAVTPSYSECTFAGQPAAVKANACAYVFDFKTTAGNMTGGEHANLEISCAEGHSIELDTAGCTITIGSQVIKDAVRYEEDTTNSFTAKMTAHNVVLGRKRTTEAQPLNGCLVYPIGAIGKLAGDGTTECLEDEGEPQVDPTTPDTTEDGEATECSPE